MTVHLIDLTSDLLLRFTPFYFICILLSFLFWNLSDPKGKFRFSTFITNNKVPLYLDLCSCVWISFGLAARF